MIITRDEITQKLRDEHSLKLKKITAETHNRDDFNYVEYHFHKCGYTDPLLVVVIPKFGIDSDFNKLLESNVAKIILVNRTNLTFSTADQNLIFSPEQT